MIATLCAAFTLPALIAQVHAKDPMQQLVEKLQSPGSMDEFADKLINKFADRALKTSPSQSADKFMERAKLDDTTLGKETVKSMQLQLASAESAQQLAEEKAVNATRSMQSAESKATQAQSAQKAAEEKAASATKKMQSAESKTAQSQSAQKAAAEKAASATQKMQSAESEAAQARSAQRAAEAKSTQEIRSADSKVAHAQASRKAAEDKAQSAESGEAKARAAKKAAQAKALQEEKVAKQAEEQKAQAESEATRARAAQKAMAAKASQMEQQLTAQKATAAKASQMEQEQTEQLLNFTKSEAKSELSAKKTEAKEAKVNQKSFDATAESLTQQELAEPSTGSAVFTMLLPAGCAVAMASASALGYAVAKRRNLPKCADASEGYVTLV